MQIKKLRNDISGFILLDKPLGMTSNDALQRVKRLFNAKKAGHTGSLDPLATGLLPLCFGEGTKLSQYLLDADKTYVVTGLLGVQTTTGDMEGDVCLESAIPEDWQAQLPAVIERFMGESTQIPSMYSALKHEGKPLYEYARAGISIEREPRTIHIFKVKVLALTDTTMSLEICCSKGTYIRTLIEDMAKALGTCGVVQTLARTAVGPYDMHEMISLEALENIEKIEGFQGVVKYLQPLESALALWPAIELNTVATHYIRQGQAIRVPLLPESGLVRILGVGRRFLGIGEVLGDGRVAPKRLISETSDVN